MKPVVTAKQLAADVQSWPADGLTTIVFAYECYTAHVRLTRDHRGVLVICRCGIAVRELFAHPGGRGLICADCRRPVQIAVEMREGRAEDRTTRASRKRAEPRQDAKHSIATQRGQRRNDVFRKR